MQAEIGEGVITAFLQTELGIGVAGLHFAPVQQLVTLGDDAQVAIGLRQAR